MATLRMQCSNCNKTWEEDSNQIKSLVVKVRIVGSCHSCQPRQEAQLDREGHPVLLPWDPDKVFENFNDDGMKFRTRRDMVRYCKSEGLSSGALL